MPNDFDTPCTSMNATDHSHLPHLTLLRILPVPPILPSDRSQPRFGEPHQAIQAESDEPDRQDREQDVRVNQAVVFLPEKSTDAWRARQHLARDDHQPRNPEAEPVSGEEIGKSG